MAADLRQIYGALTAELDDYEGKWSGKYASIAPTWRRAWQMVIPRFERSSILSMSLKAFKPVIRKSITTRGSFPTEEAATKLVSWPSATIVGLMRSSWFSCANENRDGCMGGLNGVGDYGDP